MLRDWICCPDLFSLLLFFFFLFSFVFLEDNVSFIDARAPAKEDEALLGGRAEKECEEREEKRGC